MRLSAPGQRQFERELLPAENKAHPLILASASPRRARILKLAGIPFQVVSCPTEPRHPCSAPPHRAAVKQAIHKALGVARRYPHRLVLGADTVVSIDDVLLGKPRDLQDAQRMLAWLGGRSHRVYTGLAFALCPRRRSHILWHGWESTEVRFRPLCPAEIAAYVATGEPLDKAGAYGIQGPARHFVEWIRGSYYNVVGLPIGEVVKALRVLGWPELPDTYARQRRGRFPGVRTVPHLTCRRRRR